MSIWQLVLKKIRFVEDAYVQSNENILTAQQDILIELWSVFDHICKKHKIPYMLFAGTALGAVRHQGIIPWDDDLDVVMLRKDYQRFLTVAADEIDAEKYFLQGEFSEHWPMFFSKLRKNNTTFMERMIPKDTQMHQGVYIDIFPCDNLSDHKLIRKLQFAASKIIIAKSLWKRGYLTNSKKKKIFMTLCRILPAGPFLSLIRQDGKDTTSQVHTFLGAGKAYEKNVYPREWFQESVELEFCGRKAPVTKYYDQMLTTLYGNYMTPLPESQRNAKIHAEIVDLERPYTEYLDKQKNMKYEEYTISIR